MRASFDVSRDMSSSDLPANETDWWRGAVLYQIYPRSFFDSNGDGVGDLVGIIEKLAYVAELGVDGIWISPFFTSPMRDFGYDIADFRGVDPVFGTLDDFDALIRRAHELKLKVIIDQVFSHTSNQHAWFVQSRSSPIGKYADWYVWAAPRADGSPPNNWQSVFSGPAWTWNTARQQYYLHNFLPEQPDLNLHCPEVQNAIIEVMRFWLDRGVDGVRLDAVPFYMHDPQLRDNPHCSEGAKTKPVHYQQQEYNYGRPETETLLKRIRSVLDEYGDRFGVAEVGDGQSFELTCRYADGCEHLHTAYNFFFLEASALSPALVKEAVRGWQSASKYAWPTWAFSNHDRPRVLTRWGGVSGTQELAQLLNVLLLSLYGTVFIYQGEELGLNQADVPYSKLRDPEALANWPITCGRDGTRTPMPWNKDSMNCGFSSAEPWLPLDARHANLAVDEQVSDPSSTLSVTSRLLRFRRDHPALIQGEIELLDAPDPVLAFLRKHQRAHLLCVFNVSPESVSWDLPRGGVWQLLAGSSVRGRAITQRAILAPHGWLVAQRRAAEHVQSPAGEE